MKRKRSTVRIRRYPRRRVFTLSIEQFLALYEPAGEPDCA